MKDEMKKLGRLQLNVLSKNELISTKAGGFTSVCWGGTKDCWTIVNPIQKLPK